MQRPSALEEVSSPRSDQSAATPNTDYLQEALDTLVAPLGPDYNEFRGPYQAPSSWPYADRASSPSPAAVDLDALPTAVEIDIAAVGPTGLLCPEADGSCPADMSKRKLNREHQRRFRMRSKVCNKLQAFHKPLPLNRQVASTFQARTQAIQAELATTKAELQKLKAEREQLHQLSSNIPDPSTTVAPAKVMTSSHRLFTLCM